MLRQREPQSSLPVFADVGELNIKRAKVELLLDCIFFFLFLFSLLLKFPGKASVSQDLKDVSGRGVSQRVQNDRELFGGRDSPLSPQGGGGGVARGTAGRSTSRGARAPVALHPRSR